MRDVLSSTMFENKKFHFLVCLVFFFSIRKVTFFSSCRMYMTSDVTETWRREEIVQGGFSRSESGVLISNGDNQYANSTPPSPASFDVK